MNKNIEEKLISEAEDVGLEYLGKGRNNQNKLYRFTGCGHEQEISSSAVRNNSFQCRECIKLKHEEDAKRNNLVIVRESVKSNYKIYKCLICGHEQEFCCSHIRSNSFKCDKCHQNKLNEEAEKQNLIIIGEGKNSHYKLYQFNECKHKQEIAVSDVRRGKLECEHCKLKKWENEAKEKGLIFISRGNKTPYNNYKFESCGHIQEISVVNVRYNHFVCHTCNGIYLSNGLLVASRYEQIVGDYFISNDINFEYDIRLGENTRHRTDYYLPTHNLFIEIAGLLRDNKRENKHRKLYSERLKEKHDLYYTDKSVLYLYESDFYSLKWKDKIQVELLK